MEDKYIQLQLNFEMALSCPQRNEALSSTGGAVRGALVRYVVASSNVVQMKDLREQRERIKRIEEEHLLMERIRAQVAHLQA